MFFTPVGRSKFILSALLLGVITGVAVLFYRALPSTPAAKPPVAEPVAVASALALPPAALPMKAPTKLRPEPTPAPTFSSMHLNSEEKHSVTFLFEGTTPCKRSSCSYARVVARVQIDNHTETRDALIDSKGRYAVEIPVLAGVDQPADWALEMIAEDGSSKERAGRRIIGPNESSVHLSDTLALLPEPIQASRFSLKSSEE